MISYETSHYNLQAIQKANQAMNRASVARDYRIYGIKAEYPFLMHIEAARSNRIDDLVYWLQAQGVSTRFEVASPCSGDIRIGLRRDMRRDSAFSAALIKTMIAYLEHKHLERISLCKLPRRKFMGTIDNGGF